MAMTTRHVAGRKRVETPSADSEAVEDPPVNAIAPQRPVAIPLPPHYLLPPTIPSPFTPTLGASLSAILDFAQLFTQAIPGLTKITTALLSPPSYATNWSSLVQPFLYSEAASGELMEEVLFLVTRTLLPNQIAQNRELMRQLYTAKNRMGNRLTLRYDMLRSWKKGSHGHPLVVQSDPPCTAAYLQDHSPPMTDPQYPFRRPLMPNVITTLIVAPAGGYETKGSKERMKHHVTALDDVLLLSDEDVDAWDDIRLEMKICEAISQWMWLRDNNEKLEDMSLTGWEDLAGEDGAEWFAEY